MGRNRVVGLLRACGSSTSSLLTLFTEVVWLFLLRVSWLVAQPVRASEVSGYQAICTAKCVFANAAGASQVTCRNGSGWAPASCRDSLPSEVQK
jgi:hypothetical protein